MKHKLNIIDIVNESEGTNTYYLEKPVGFLGKLEPTYTLAYQALMRGKLQTSNGLDICLV